MRIASGRGRQGEGGEAGEAGAKRGASCRGYKRSLRHNSGDLPDASRSREEADDDPAGRAHFTRLHTALNGSV